MQYFLALLGGKPRPEGIERRPDTFGLGPAEAGSAASRSDCAAAADDDRGGTKSGMSTSRVTVERQHRRRRRYQVADADGDE